MTKSADINYRDFLKIPNLLTTGRIFLAFLILVFTCMDFKIYLVKWFFIGGIISDKLDGFLARKLNQKTKLGLVLEQIADTWLVFYTILFITYRLDFPYIIFIAYLSIIFTGLFGLVTVFILKKELFAEKLIMAELAIVFIYGAGIFYLFSLPGRIYLAILLYFLVL
jgi:phosphatidylglycerophosphate synthase